MPRDSRDVPADAQARAIALVKELRKGMSEKDLAARLGVDRSVVNKWCNADPPPGIGFGPLVRAATLAKQDPATVLGLPPPTNLPRWGDDAAVLGEARRLAPRAPWDEIAALPMPSGCVPTVRALLHLVDAIGVAREAAEVDVPLAGTKVRPVGEVVEEPLETPAATPARAPSRRRA